MTPHLLGALLMKCSCNGQLTLEKAGGGAHPFLGTKYHGEKVAEGNLRSPTFQSCCKNRNTTLRHSLRN